LEIAVEAGVRVYTIAYMHRTFLLAAYMFGVTSAFAGQAFYAVTVDTSTISGSTGLVDFSFNPATGTTPQFAFSEILNFHGGTLIGPPSITGDIGGALPGILVLNNDTPVNDYSESFRFGPSIFFDLLIAGPALTNPGPFMGTTTFAFDLFNSSGAPLLTSGPLFTVDVNAGGNTTLTVDSPAVTITPEPAALLMLITAVAALGVAGVFSKQRRSVRIQ
jgi:hypothetical protein